MSSNRNPVRADVDGMAVIGRTLHDLRGIRFTEGEGGNAPAGEAAAAIEGTTEAAATATDWKAEARKWEARAKENSTAATRLSEIEEASKTEAQKLADRASAAESRVAEFEKREQVAAWKAEVATATGVPAALLAGSTKEEIEAHAAIAKPLIENKTPPRSPALSRVNQSDAPSASTSPGQGTLRAAYAEATSK